ncbi:hypothetical protein [Mesorhizobium sp. M1B.F.Ca.ET.045.04.1.1]|uniref:hypothetical protein n=1 Tax=Mesorhizobium sp. M1B.F.Ca.ET.045.04.1.1 TaxID=2493673 RepID=UPI000F74C1C0|nr:hypothetical protein [Mesorhizobium sp. M1B.F.Ca.ET.045.04.1.1]AZO29388.1 hypothetical protein EJ071_19675 [Mesorhizobium sp. M1B.F.Ca.ET.045.04.1.1]
MDIERIEENLGEAIAAFRKYPVTDDRCHEALMEFRAACTTNNIDALLDELSRLREAEKRYREALETIRDGYGPDHLSRFARNVAGHALQEGGE